MKILRFGATYGAPPIFDPGLESMGYVDLADLRISDVLKWQIDLWNQQYQETFSDDYPPDSCFKSLDELIAHNKRGNELSLLLQTPHSSLKCKPLTFF
ncbi:MAG: hypothetical protein IPP74_08510 [Alphaproteobacteria bacterium]|nr:hypothetical protein [Alphaproteobacteria bacterium]